MHNVWADVLDGMRLIAPHGIFNLSNIYVTSMHIILFTCSRNFRNGTTCVDTCPEKTYISMKIILKS